MPGPDYILDIKGLRPPEQGGDAQSPAAPPPDGALKDPSLRGRPWLAVRWRCCGGYTRVYRNLQATAYEGRCPTCGRAVNVKVGQGGTSCRFFEAG